MVILDSYWIHFVHSPNPKSSVHTVPQCIWKARGISELKIESTSLWGHHLYQNYVLNKEINVEELTLQHCYVKKICKGDLFGVWYHYHQSREWSHAQWPSQCRHSSETRADPYQRMVAEEYLQEILRESR